MLSMLMCKAMNRSITNLLFRLSLFIDAVGIVEFGRAVDAQADEELIFDQEFAPRVVEQRAVGLEGIMDFFAVGVFFLEPDRLAKKLTPRSVGSPPCQAKLISGLACCSMICRT